jgi:exosome complex component RRP4
MKVLSIQSTSSRYSAAVGDVVVGRILAVSEKDRRWRVEIASNRSAQLCLNAIELPGGGAQRRRNERDEMDMRKFYQVQDVIAAEVQKIHHDGTVMLQVRDDRKYGRLGPGLLVAVSQSLLRKQKQHFVSLDVGVELILGCNGWIWVTGSALGQARALRSAARVRNSILVLDACGLQITPVSIMFVYDASVEMEIEAKAMLDAESLALLSNLAREHQSSLPTGGDV